MNRFKQFLKEGDVIAFNPKRGGSGPPPPPSILNKVKEAVDKIANKKEPKKWDSPIFASSYSEKDISDNKNYYHLPTTRIWNHSDEDTASPLQVKAAKNIMKAYGQDILDHHENKLSDLKKIHNQVSNTVAVDKSAALEHVKRMIHKHELMKKSVQRLIRENE